jgi:eukaryotic-like serine/threonine-protein kinase
LPISSGAHSSRGRSDVEARRPARIIHTHLALAPGTRLGSYEIVSALGAGGMGEVYRARDAALRRDVAVKVLPVAFAHDEERLRRFAQEAQAAAALNHPNILAIFQVGQHDEAPFIVSELLAGETLRDRLREGALPVRKAVDYAVQTARGLAAAHEKGIIHRDLKPENIFITDDGRAKILDFGIAKLVAAEDAADGATVSAQTASGTVLGTIGYMSPEQVRGQAVDTRADIFSFGAILYEMLSGRGPFKKDTAPDTITAVLREDPPELAAAERGFPPALERIVKRCLEKNPPERFQSARDLAFALEDVSSISTGHVPVTTEPARRFTRPMLIAGVIGILLLAGVAGAVWRRLNIAPATQPTYQRLTFRRGAVLSARFAPDAKTVVYGAAWDGNPPETFVATADSPESRSLGIPKSDIYAVSSSGELAISLRTGGPFPPQAGVLARVPLLGGAAPREVMNKVEYADWGPDGSIAVTLDTGVGDRLEYPVGTMLYEVPGPVHQIRVSPDGNLVAFQEITEGLSAIAIVDKQKKKTTLGSGWLQVDGLAWTRSGDELWFAGKSKDSGWGLFAVTLTGKLRLLLRMPGEARLEDLASDGRALLSRETPQTGIRYFAPGATEETDLSWLDRSALDDLSRDGQLLLFSESGEAGGADGAVYLRKTDGSPAVKLGAGVGVALSPDAKWAMTISRTSLEMNLLPTGAGAPVRMKGAFARYWGGGQWLPDGKRVMFTAMEPQHDPRVYIQELPGEPRAISPEGVISGAIVSPEGGRVAAVISGKAYLLTAAGGAPQPLPGVAPNDVPIVWSADGRSIFVRTGDVAAEVSRVDLTTGVRSLWKTLIPSDRAGITGVRSIRISPDGGSYAYSYNRLLSELYLVDGLR